MNCNIHPDRDAVGSCTICGKPICQECAVEMQNKLVCRTCLSEGKVASGLTSATPTKNRTTALLLEILPAFIGLLGFGWIYSGAMTTGFIVIVCSIVYDVANIILLFPTFGFSLCFCIPVAILAVAWSAFFLHMYTKQHPELFGPS
jgi:hypothetical protein